MVKIGRYLIDPERVLYVEDSRNRAAHPGVTIRFERCDIWIDNVTLDDVAKVLERHLDTL